MQYTIEINDNSEDSFINDDDNVLSVRIYDEGKDVTGERTVQLFLSKNAMLGLGTELIRFAHDYREGRHFHLEPISKDYIVQTMGVFLTPDSAKLIICCSDSKKVDEYLQD